jgi:hypothetical protein
MLAARIDEKKCEQKSNFCEIGHIFLGIMTSKHLFRRILVRNYSKVIMDCRSDTLTMPSVGMRHVMAKAQVGDDVFGEDPTAKQLEESVAGIFSKESGLFVPTGTMANLIAVMVHCWSGRGHKIVLGDKSHLHLDEQEGIAQVSLWGRSVD